MSHLAIVGLACDYGQGTPEGAQDLDAFARALYGGTVSSCNLDEVASPSLDRIAEQLLKDVVAPVRIGVIVCAGSGFAAGSAAGSAVKARALAAWVADAVGDNALPLFAGLAEGDLGPALRMSGEWLDGSGTSGGADLVLIAAEDCKGVGAVLLARDDSVRSGTIYARIEHMVEGPSVDVDQSDSIGYLETGTWPPDPDVVAAYALPEPDLTCALGSLAAAWGEVSPVAALIKVTLAIHRRTLYPSPEPPGAVEGWEGGPFYIVPRARPWFAPDSQTRRAAMVHKGAGGWLHLRLAEPGPDRQDVLLRGQLRSEGGCYLLPVAGAGPGELLAGLAALRQELEGCSDPAVIVRRAIAMYDAAPDAAYALALVGHSRDELLKEIAYAVEGVGKAFEPGSRRRDWQTPKGSAFTADPLGHTGVAFVYPGAFNAYVGLGQDLLQHFPGLYASFDHLTIDLGSRFAERWLYPRSRAWEQPDDAEMWQARLHDHPVALIESGAMVAVAHTLLLRRLFGVQPEMALGYSLGEISMLWAGGVWQEADKGSASFSTSSLFENRVVGPKLAIREHWGLAPDEAMTWTSYLLKAEVEAVQEAAAHETRVYVTLINLPDEVVIGGEVEACRRVIALLGCHALAVPYDVAIHNEAIASEYKRLVSLYRHQVYERPDVRFYSAAHYEPLTLEETALAEAIATMSCHVVDFPRLVQRVYDDGARLFIELGPLATCTRRIKRILKGLPHMAVAMNPSPGGDLEGVLGVLAGLVSHRVPVNLTALYEERVPPSIQVTPRVMLAPEPVEEHEPEDLAAQAVYETESAGATAAFQPGLVDAHASGVFSGMHRSFLAAREAAQTGAGALIGLQVAVSHEMLGAQSDAAASRATARGTGGGARNAGVFTEADVRTFATGDVARCFGSDYEIYRGRRVPRIPNGDLQFMTRVMAIQGEPGRFQGEPALWSEFDVPARGWFDPGGVGLPPHVALMEIALQPCGFLSAYLRSPMLLPEADLYFRNLDGHARILAEPDVRGRTISNQVRLLSSTRAQGVILQKFTFAMSCEGVPFYEGDASFGFFPREAMLRQSGAEAPANGERRSASRVVPPHPGTVPLTEPVPHQLQLLHRMVVEPDGGRYGKGYVRGEGQVTPWDWFFRAHFHEDPVMPGSLGVEAAAQALRAFGRWQQPSFAHAVAATAAGPVQAWKYRGQIAPPGNGVRANGAWSVEVHLAEVREDVAHEDVGHADLAHGDMGRSLLLTGDAEVWRGSGPHDRVRIYEINGLSVRLDMGKR